jgi:hypothetical protein
MQHSTHPAGAARSTGSAGRSSYAKQVITKTPPWRWLTAWDVLLNNLSIGVFLLAAIGVLLAPGSLGTLAPAALLLALLLLLADLLLMVSDLGDPLRFHHMLRVFKPGSPMSLGTWALSLYGVFLGIAALAVVLNWIGVGGMFPAPDLAAWIAWAGKAAVILAILPALAGILYKGVLFSLTSQPGWKEARWFGGYLTNSAVLLGCAVLLPAAIIFNLAKAESVLHTLLLALLVSDAIFLALLYRDVASVFGVRYERNLKRAAWILIPALGILLPFVLLAWGNRAMAVAACLLALASALAVRYLFVYLPHSQTVRK